MLFSLSKVEPIVNEVKNRGDAAVREYTLKFDKAKTAVVCAPIDAIEVRDGWGNCPKMSISIIKFLRVNLTDQNSFLSRISKNRF